MMIKICGITTQKDADAAVEAGATLLGFIFAPSERQITLETARQITTPDKIGRVGVFVDQTLEQVLDCADGAGLTAVQLHGDESALYVKELKTERPDLYVIKAFETDTPQETIDSYDCDAVLLDAPKEKPSRLDETSPLRSEKPLMIAGGLNSENVGRYLARFGAQGVDVCSGVESSPGTKDPAKLRAFVNAIKECRK